MFTAVQAAEEFKDIIPVLRESWQRAWRDMLTRFNDPNWDGRCRSTVIQMQAVIHFRLATYDHHLVTPHIIDNRHVFVVNESGLFHFKQLDSGHCSKNIPTRAAMAFLEQDEIPGFESYSRFTVGLVPKPDWTDYVGIYMTFPKATGQNNWVLDITKTAVDIDTLQNEFDESVSQPPRRFKPIRKPGEKRRGEAGA
jgi:hypothetical protein